MTESEATALVEFIKDLWPGVTVSQALEVLDKLKDDRMQFSETRASIQTLYAMHSDFFRWSDLRNYLPAVPNTGNNTADAQTEARAKQRQDDEQAKHANATSISTLRAQIDCLTPEELEACKPDALARLPECFAARWRDKDPRQHRIYAAAIMTVANRILGATA